MYNEYKSGDSFRQLVCRPGIRSRLIGAVWTGSDGVP